MIWGTINSYTIWVASFNPTYHMWFDRWTLLGKNVSSWCWHTVSFTVWHRLTLVAVGQGTKALSVDHSEQLFDTISTCGIKQGLLLLLLFFCSLFVCFLFSLFFIYFPSYLFFFLTNNNIISVSTVEFIYYIVIIILINLGKR